VILGIVLIVAGFVLIALAASSGHRGVLIASILGALFILGAAFNGASFLNFNDDLSSMIMAGLFAAALACYVVVLFQLNDAPAAAGTGNVVS
jgi:drug/metabolite transporter (DMT)-like permease